MSNGDQVSRLAGLDGISLATPEDIPGIVALQEANLPQNGGSLSVRQSADWFLRTMLEMPLVMARRDGKVVGYVVSSSLGAQSHVPIVQAMLGAFYRAARFLSLWSDLRRGNGTGQRPCRCPV